MVALCLINLLAKNRKLTGNVSCFPKQILNFIWKISWTTRSRILTRIVVQSLEIHYTKHFYLKLESTSTKVNFIPQKIFHKMWYLEQLCVAKILRQNIKHLHFHKSSVLYSQPKIMLDFVLLFRGNYEFKQRETDSTLSSETLNKISVLTKTKFT